MNEYRTFRTLVFLGLCITHSFSAAADTAYPSRTWSNTAWQIRYLLFVDTTAGRVENSKVARLNNADDGKERVYLDVDELLTANNILVTAGAPAISTSLLLFDENGGVVTNDRALRGLSARLSKLGHLVLIRKDAPHAKPYSMLYWSQGIPGSIEPSPCTLIDTYRYEGDWKNGEYPGDFGCREWTAQLMNKVRPYIDVTTYTENRNFIGQFVGWSRFEDAPKPIIGMNGKTWLCLHECPAGEKSGVIADIKAWTAKHQYPMPVRPAMQPEYPDKDYSEEYCVQY
nr:hypothetical protein [uncultured Duganella sp.]